MRAKKAYRIGSLYGHTVAVIIEEDEPNELTHKEIIAQIVKDGVMPKWITADHSGAIEFDKRHELVGEVVPFKRLPQTSPQPR